MTEIDRVRHPSTSPARTRRHGWLWAVLAVAIAAASLVPTSAGAQRPRITENSATRWMARALVVVRSGSPSQHTSTPGAARTYAMATAAMYDAVNGIDVAAGRSERSPALVESYSAAPKKGDREAAVSAAAHGVLRSLFAANPSASQSLDAALHEELVGDDGKPARVEEGRAWGAAVAEEVLAQRAADGTQVAETVPGSNGPGANPRSFSGAQFRRMVLFGISSIDPYRSPGPPALASPEYAAAFEEVRVLGSATDTDPERSAIARHWLAEGGSVRETGLWLKAALVVVKTQGTAASLSDTSQLLAMLGMGIADAVVVSWSDKYDFGYWRPGDAIRQAEDDGNPATSGDAGWNPRNGPCTNPNLAFCTSFGGSPEHTSGTSTFAGAASSILRGFYGRDDVSFAFAGEQTGAPERTYGSFSEAAAEAGRSRIYGGIHFEFSNQAGQEAGRGAGEEILQRLGDHLDEDDDD